MLRLRADALTWGEVEGEVVAVDSATSTYLAVNHTGAFLWPSLVEGASEDDLVRRLVERYDVGDEQARLDLEGFLAPLRARGLLEDA